jgi:hypothetical protein
LFLDQRFPEAEKAFKKAVSCRPNETDAVEWLKAIDQMMGKNKGKTGGLDTVP